MNTEEIRQEHKEAQRVNNEATKATMEARLLCQGYHLFDVTPMMILLNEWDDEDEQ
jgi:hypothetical protein